MSNWSGLNIAVPFIKRKTIYAAREMFFLLACIKSLCLNIIQCVTLIICFEYEISRCLVSNYSNCYHRLNGFIC